MENTRILLVEDNPDDEELTLRAFKKHNLANEVVVARDGVEALQYLFPNDDEVARESLPNLVLLDLKLPRVSGLEVLRRIRSQAATRRLPVVVLTSSNEERDIVQSYDLGANSFIRKPVDFEDFIQGVQQLGLYWLVMNQPSPR